MSVIRQIRQTEATTITYVDIIGTLGTNICGEIGRTQDNNFTCTSVYEANCGLCGPDGYGGCNQCYVFYYDDSAPTSFSPLSTISLSTALPGDIVSFAAFGRNTPPIIYGEIVVNEASCPYFRANNNSYSSSCIMYAVDKFGNLFAWGGDKKSASWKYNSGFYEYISVYDSAAGTVGNLPASAWSNRQPTEGSNGSGREFSTINSLNPSKIPIAIKCSNPNNTNNNFGLLYSDGTVGVWGISDYGAIGNLKTAALADRYQYPAGIFSAGTSNAYDNLVKALDCSYTCLAIKNNGTLWGWGKNNLWQAAPAGTGSSQLDKNSPTQIGSASDWVKVSSTGETQGAIKSNGQLYVWGNNSYGSAGTGSVGYISTPTFVANAKHVCMGYYASHLLTADGAIYGCGFNFYGSVGDGTSTDRTTWTRIGLGNDWAWIANGGQGIYAHAIKTNGTLWGWGANTVGQIGNSTTTNYSSPVQIGTLSNWAMVRGGYGTTIAVKTDGTLWTWGYNFFGEAGQNNTTLYVSPVQVGSDSDWLADEHLLGCNYGNCWAVKNSDRGGIYVSGLGNDLGMYGYLGVKSSRTFVRQYNTNNVIGTGYKFVAADNFQEDPSTVTAGGAFAIKTNGTLWAWGRNTNGCLGDSTTTTRSSPVQIGALSNWAQITIANTTTLAIKTDGTLWAWGDNANGCLGDGTTVNKSSPVQIGAGTDWASVEIGYRSVFARKTNNTLWTWGSNVYGKLGTSNTTGYSSPVQVGTLSNWAVVRPSNSTYFGLWDSTLAVKTDGTLWGWGRRILGSSYSSPVQIGSVSDYVDIERNLEGIWNPSKYVYGGAINAVGVIRSDGGLYSIDPYAASPSPTLIVGGSGGDKVTQAMSTGGNYITLRERSFPKRSIINQPKAFNF